MVEEEVVAVDEEPVVEEEVAFEEEAEPAPAPLPRLRLRHRLHPKRPLRRPRMRQSPETAPSRQSPAG